MRGASTNRFYKRLFRLAGNERLKSQTDQTQTHAHATGAMALDGLGLASGLLATGARLGRGLSGLRLGLNDGRLDLLNLGCGRLRLGLGNRCGIGLRLNDGLWLLDRLGFCRRGSDDSLRLGNRLDSCFMLNLDLNSFFGHTFFLLRTLLRGGLGVAIGALQ